jgi:mannose-6-phosphate isomerase-like protein (cupin superfamily)
MTSNPSDAGGLWFMTGLLIVDLSNKDNDDGVSIIEHRMALDFAPPLHIHHNENETFRILEGTFRFQRGNELHVLNAGDTIYLPKGIQHGFRVISPEGGRCLTVTAGKFEDMVRAASRPAPVLELPEQAPPTSDQQATLARICAENGIEFVGPPIQ